MSGKAGVHQLFPQMTDQMPCTFARLLNSHSEQDCYFSEATGALNVTQANPGAVRNEQWEQAETRKESAY